jgi:excisionase family DNA binding protein
MEKLLKIEEAAQILASSPRTIRKWIGERRLGSVKIGKSVRISASEIERIQKQGRREAISL